MPKVPDGAPSRSSITDADQPLAPEPARTTPLDDTGGIKADARTAIVEIWAERQRQISREGWSIAHDDKHENGELADAAVCYANQYAIAKTAKFVPIFWPWDAEWWKPKDRRSNLIRAAALLVAEIERLDRKAVTP